MNVFHRALAAPLRRLARLAILALIALPLALPAGSAVAADDAPITLNFRDADIDSVIGAFGHLMDRTFIIDPRVRGKIQLRQLRCWNM